MRTVGPWLPEPLLSNQEPTPGPDARTELAESLSLAFLVLLERLSPLERAAFLLREVFDQPFADVAAVLGTTEVATRQLVARARAHVNENRPRYRASEEKKHELLRVFLVACASADPTALMQRSSLLLPCATSSICLMRPIVCVVGRLFGGSLHIVREGSRSA